jgi:hypothetical protein
LTKIKFYDIIYIKIREEKKINPKGSDEDLP